MKSHEIRLSFTLKWSDTLKQSNPFIMVRIYNCRSSGCFPQYQSKIYLEILYTNLKQNVQENNP